VFAEEASKKLSSIATSTVFELATSALSVTDKSFLVLFFKKELLAFIPFQ